jgi:hypothetical protein
VLTLLRAVRVWFQSALAQQQVRSTPAKRHKFSGSNVVPGKSNKALVTNAWASPFFKIIYNNTASIILQ